LLEGGTETVLQGGTENLLQGGSVFAARRPRTSGSRVAEAASAAGATQQNFGVFHWFGAQKMHQSALLLLPFPSSFFPFFGWGGVKFLEVWRV